MLVNDHKSLINFNGLTKGESEYAQILFSFHSQDMEEGLKYLCFYLNNFDYKITEWQWIIVKIEKIISSYSFSWFSCWKVGTYQISFQKIPFF